jgi:acetyl-CoA synthetase
MVGAGTSCKYLFDLRPGDVYWCTADCGWITGHTYLTYGPMLNGVTQVLFGSTPAYPDAGRCWRIVEKYDVSENGGEGGGGGGGGWRIVGVGVQGVNMGE